MTDRKSDMSSSQKKAGHMTSVKRLFVGMFVGVGLLVGSAPAQAVPLLQMDILNGRYDESSRTVVAREGMFTLLALLTPDATLEPDLSRWLNETYYIAAAVTPQTYAPGADLGTITFDGPDLTGQLPSTGTSPGGTVRVTADMVFGNPPLESDGAIYDSGDMAPHDIYDTYFTEFQFRFNPLNQTTPWDSRLDGRHTSIPAGGAGMYYAAFTVNTADLAPTHAIHFDVYNTRLRNCVAAGTCADEDLKLQNDFDHDAQSAPVPEPASLLLLGSGLFAMSRVAQRYRKPVRP
jgi:hypothetical protein